MDGKPKAHGHSGSLVAPLHSSFNIPSPDFPGGCAVESKDSLVNVLELKPFVVKSLRVEGVAGRSSLNIWGVIERVADDPLSGWGDRGVGIGTGVGVLCWPGSKRSCTLILGCNWERDWSCRTRLNGFSGA